MPNNLAETPNEVRNIKLKPTTVRAHTHTHTRAYSKCTAAGKRIQGKHLLAVRLRSESKAHEEHEKNPIQSGREWALKVNKM